MKHGRTLKAMRKTTVNGSLPSNYESVIVGAIVGGGVKFCILNYSMVVFPHMCGRVQPVTIPNQFRKFCSIRLLIGA